MKDYCIGKVSEMVFGYNAIDERNYYKFKLSVLDLATEMYNEPLRGYENVDEAVYSLMNNFYNDAYSVLLGRMSFDELKYTWSVSSDIVLCS